ncbi:MAG: hypothetical protein COV34_03575 [Candidatus Zambryskibacteria bacterium CG10_big_fil_rev_8_21_14_0_10_42_12]|uniref:Four helix bundle protein n=1 Tax=Candidatus Zambryskibacteria bacterium CG10_big_fil_rev_8_21_14_0_10_42_12 TaxID=1975115 RepID=A0A2H0QSJ7_9BACT|nr:MAG: hypothetical protein COV34_03575 [Candidatus Zambryskibacteria bacterium CG10_big_fil_rev_8_21_14_0_10_42_12]
MTSYKELRVWQEAKDLSISVYKQTQDFPKSELYGLISQLRRSAVSVPSNIAEGRHRGTRKDFIQFLRIANGSLAELETQLNIAHELNYIKDIDYKNFTNHISTVSKMLNGMIKKLEAKS